MGERVGHAQTGDPLGFGGVGPGETGGARDSKLSSRADTCERPRSRASIHSLKAAGRGSPFLLVRLNDWVPVIAQRARVAVERRILPTYAGAWLVWLPLLLRLGPRSRHDPGDLVERGVHAARHTRAASCVTDPALVRQRRDAADRGPLAPPASLVGGRTNAGCSPGSHRCGHGRSIRRSGLREGAPFG